MVMMNYGMQRAYGAIGMSGLFLLSLGLGIAGISEGLEYYKDHSNKIQNDPVYRQQVLQSRAEEQKGLSKIIDDALFPGGKSAVFAIR